MSQREKLVRDIETLKSSLRHGWRDISVALTTEEIAGLRTHIEGCMNELQDLHARLEKLDGKGP